MELSSNSSEKDGGEEGDVEHVAVASPMSSSAAFSPRSSSGHAHLSSSHLDVMD